MSFREKSAWFTALGLLLVLGLFLPATVNGMSHPFGPHSPMILLAILVGFVVVRVVFQLVTGVTTPTEARAPADEREQWIALKAARNAGLVLIVAVLAVPGSLHVAPLGPIGMGYLAMLGLVASELARAGSKIFYYRTGH